MKTWRGPLEASQPDPSQRKCSKGIYAGAPGTNRDLSKAAGFNAQGIPQLTKPPPGGMFGFQARLSPQPREGMPSIPGKISTRPSNLRIGALPYNINLLVAVGELAFQELLALDSQELRDSCRYGTACTFVSMQSSHVSRLLCSSKQAMKVSAVAKVAWDVKPQYDVVLVSRGRSWFGQE